jgi:hypothetical protein
VLVLHVIVLILRRGRGGDKSAVLLLLLVNLPENAAVSLTGSSADGKAVPRVTQTVMKTSFCHPVSLRAARCVSNLGWYCSSEGVAWILESCLLVRTTALEVSEVGLVLESVLWLACCEARKAPKGICYLVLSGRLTWIACS